MKEVLLKITSKSYVIANEICLDGDLLPGYTHIYIHTYTLGVFHMANNKVTGKKKLQFWLGKSYRKNLKFILCL